MNNLPYHLQPQVVNEKTEQDKVVVTLCNTNNHYDVTVEPHVVDIPDNAYRTNFRRCTKTCGNPNLDQKKTTAPQRLSRKATKAIFDF